MGSVGGRWLRLAHADPMIHMAPFDGVRQRSHPF